MKSKIIIFIVLFASIFSFMFLLANYESSESFKFLESLPVINKISSEKETTMIFVGDIMLSRLIDKIMVQKDDRDFPFQLIKSELKADIIFGNLEGPISSRGQNMGSIYSFRADPDVAISLQNAGFNILSLANNHIWDYGKDAFSDTFSILEKQGIKHVGAGKNYNESHEPVILEVNGRKIAFLSYTNLLPPFLLKQNSSPSVANMLKDDVVSDISKVKSSNIADVIVVAFHWGEEYQTKHNVFQEKLAKEAVDSGADLVIGSHPHVVQEIEKYKKSYIAYSLGNFIFDQNFSKDTKEGLILKVILENGKIKEVIPVKIKFNKHYQPYAQID